MMSRIEITGVRYTPDDVTKRYVRKKIGTLDRYVSRHARKTLSADVKLKEVNRAHGNKYECEVILQLPESVVTATDSTMNMLAAIDIVEEKLKNQLKRYHDEHADHRGRHNFLGRLKRRAYKPQPDA